MPLWRVRALLAWLNDWGEELGKTFEAKSD